MTISRQPVANDKVNPLTDVTYNEGPGPHHTSAKDGQPGLSRFGVSTRDVYSGRENPKENRCHQNDSDPNPTPVTHEGCRRHTTDTPANPERVITSR